MPRNTAKDSVQWLHARGALSDRQYEAATTLRADAEVSTNHVRIGGSSGEGPRADRQIDSLRRKDACMASLDPVGAALVKAVVLDRVPLKEAGEKLGMAGTYRGPRLAEALTALADFYQI